MSRPPFNSVSGSDWLRAAPAERYDAGRSRREAVPLEAHVEAALETGRTDPLTVTAAVYRSTVAPPRAITVTLAGYDEAVGAAAMYNHWFAENAFMASAERNALATSRTRAVSGGRAVFASPAMSAPPSGTGSGSGEGAAGPPAELPFIRLSALPAGNWRVRRGAWTPA